MVGYYADCRKALVPLLSFLILVLGDLHAGTQALSACGNLFSNNNYLLTQDIIDYPSDADCFVAYQQQNITFDCQGHTVDSTDIAWYSRAFFLFHSSGVTIKNCVLTDFGRGIQLDHSSYNFIYNITANSNVNYGIKLFPASLHNTISHISASENYIGVGVYNSFDGSTASGSNSNTFSDITVSGNSGSGIYSYYSTGNSFSNIRASGSQNWWSISLESSPSNSFSSAAITSTWGGISLYDSPNNHFASVENEVGYNDSNARFYSNSAQDISSRLNTGWFPLCSQDGSAATTQANTAWYNGTAGGRNADGTANPALHYWFGACENAMPDYVSSFSMPSMIIYTNESFIFNVTTSNQGAAGIAPGTTGVSFTNVTFQGNTVGRFQILSLEAGGSATSSVSLTCPNAAGAYLVNAYADADFGIGESDETNNAASAPLACFARPVSCTLASYSHGSDFKPDDSVAVIASCKDGSGSEVACPALAWSQNAINGSMVPSSTLRRLSPNSTLSLANASPQLGRSVNAVSTEPGVPLACTPFSFNIFDISITCGFPGHGNEFYPGESSTVEAACTGGPAGGCPALAWSIQNLTSVTLNPLQTPSGPSPRTSTLAVAGAASAPQSGRLGIFCANQSGCSASCNLSIAVSPVPDRMDCRIVNHTTGSLFLPTDWSYVQANCSSLMAFPAGSLGTPAACPELDWITNLTNAAFDPRATPGQYGPLTNFSTTNAPAQSGYIDANSANPLVGGLHCTAAISTLVGAIGPDYAITQVRPERLLNNMGQNFTIEVRVKNTGNRNVASTFTATQLSGNCTLQNRQAPPLRISEEFTDTFTCSCSVPNMNTFTVKADAFNNLVETNENNNEATGLFWCGASFVPACSDYV